MTTTGVNKNLGEGFHLICPLTGRLFSQVLGGIFFIFCIYLQLEREENNNTKKKTLLGKHHPGQGLHRASVLLMSLGQQTGNMWNRWVLLRGLVSRRLLHHDIRGGLEADGTSSKDLTLGSCSTVA